MQQMLGQMRQAWTSTIADLITGQMTLRQATANIFKQMLGSFAQYLAQKGVMRAVDALKETALGKWVQRVLNMTQAETSAKNVATKSAESSAKIGASAAVAGAGAAESQASIPYIGPILAIAAMAAIMAAVMGLKGGGGGGASMPSAAGGFDIPSGMNPMTQLHEREMVLPKEQADAVRDMAAGGGRSGGDIHIHAIDAPGVRRLLLENKAALVAALRDAHRAGIT